MRNISLVVAGLMLAAGTSAQAVVAYDNLGTAATAGYTDLNSNNPVYGDSLTLAQAGTLSVFGCSLYNSTTGGNTGPILTGSMVINFYDNTTPYVSGALSDPLLGTATLTWDFTAGGGLGAGFYSTSTFDLSALNIVLTQNILVTQQFTELTGTSLRNGFVLLGNPVVGSSPANVYLKSPATPEALYTFSNNANQIAYQVNVTPAPSAAALLGLGGLIAGRRRRA